MITDEATPFDNARKLIAGFPEAEHFTALRRSLCGGMR